MPTPVLYHGPESRNFAVDLSLDGCRPVEDPLGDRGLKVDDSRHLVALAQHPGVGDKPPSIVVGPLDRATPEAADALLKTLEDLQDTPLRICLWAEDLSGVIPTIRSRTFQKWCPAQGQENPHYLAEEAEGAVRAIGEGNVSGLIRIFKEVEDRSELAQALCEPLAQAMKDNPQTYLKAWAAIRPLLGTKGDLAPILGALLPEKV